MEALESVCTKATANAAPSVQPSSVLRSQQPPPPPYDLAEWREPLARWMESDCVAHWRLNGCVGRLHVAFSEWEAGKGEVPCTRAVFEALLQEQGFEIHPTLAFVDGLMLRADVDGDESVQKLL